MNYNIILQYYTTTGFEWLEEMVTVNEDNYKSVVDRYKQENSSQARALVNKWQSDGEDVDMYLDLDNENAPAELYSKVYNYIEKIS